MLTVTMVITISVSGLVHRLSGHHRQFITDRIGDHPTAIPSTITRQITTIHAIIPNMNGSLAIGNGIPITVVGFGFPATGDNF